MSASSLPRGKPTILFIHGAYHTSDCFTPVADRLHAAGYTVLYPTLPCSHLPLAKREKMTRQDDATFVQSMLADLVDVQGKEVYVACHSYGGTVATEAVAEDTTVAVRAKQGKRGGVVGLFFICAFLLQEGQSIQGMYGSRSQRPSHVSRPVPKCKRAGRCRRVQKQPDFPGLWRATPEAAADLFYNDLAPAEAALWSEKLTYWPRGLMDERSSGRYRAHKVVPTTWLLCEKDNAIPLGLQRGLLEAAREEGGLMEERTCGAGHSPFLSEVGYMAIEIVRAVEKAVGIDHKA